MSEHQDEFQNQEELQNDDTGQSDPLIAIPEVVVEDERIETGTTRYGRKVKPPERYTDRKTTLNVQQESVPEDQSKDPQSAREALSAADAGEWKISMKEEYENFFRNEVWAFEKHKDKMRTVKTKWAFKRKFDEEGKLVRHRARLVALGNHQRPGLDYDLTYSPVVKIKSVRMLFAISTELEW